MKFKQLLAVLVGLSISGASHAALVTFDFVGGGPNGTVLSFSQSGVTLTAKGRVLPNTGQIRHNGNGLGVRGNSTNQLDGPNELIEFSLSAPGTWISASVWGMGRDEAAGFCGTATSLAAGCDSAPSFVDGLQGVNPQTFSLAAVADWTYLNIGSVRPGGFRISSITVDIASVPEPSTFGLFAMSLLGFGALRKLREPR